MSLIDRLFHRPEEPDDEPVRHQIEELENGHGPALRRAQKAIRGAKGVLDDYQKAERAGARRGKP